ncbi:MAG TPA: PQQ-dependent dehydrogenase, methanol/ethanol family [Steroidobacteraceae bacterium]|nr:PQQ-dependent dehydrogenase, methanol/ethanol family [Steroidobacteraceae bacterium]
MVSLLALFTSASGASTAAFGNVDASRMSHADQEPGQWMANGRDAGAGYYSPLARINATNVSRLGFAWQFKTGTYRGMEATPLVVDGVLYVPGIWGAVYALDAASGAPLWSFDPHADPAFARGAGNDIVNRGLAVWKGRVYVVSTDCRLFALDARTGKTDWQVNSLVGDKRGYACSGAPQIAGHVVVVGNAGGESGKGGVRGYVSAFDADSGAFAWRFYTVPAVHDEHPTPEMQRAAATWDPSRDSSFGGGGTVWDELAYDPDLDLVYFGTGNAAPYNARRDWSGGHSGDRLYAASIVALRAATGSMAWYYQTTPGDIWDYDATASLVLATLQISGHPRRVLMQANKNGYFYVLDRRTGQPISATPYAYMNWSTGMDGAFRPIVDRAHADYDAGPKIVYPSAVGAHSWTPMSYSPASGLVYIPTVDTANILVDVRKNPGSRLSDVDQGTGVMIIIPDSTFSYGVWEPLVGALPRFPTPSGDPPRNSVRAALEAWDPVKGKRVWSQRTSEDTQVLDGGALSTAGNVVFAGREDGRFVAYDARTGKILKTIDTGTAVMAAPMTYEVDGVQYVSVLAGHGGSAYALAGTAGMRYINEGRVLTFKLDGAAAVPRPALREQRPVHEPPSQAASREVIASGESLYFTYCSRCHVLGAPAITPDLSRLEDGIDSLDVFESIVLKGTLLPMGMPRFDDTLSEPDARALHAYFVAQAWNAYRMQTRDDGRP